MRTIFVQQQWQDTLDEQGYVVLDLLNEDEVDTLRTEIQYYQTSVENKPKGFYRAAGLKDYEHRKRSMELIDQYFMPTLKRHFKEDHVDLIAGTLLIKQPGFKSKVGFHQDNMLVDETKYHAVFGWCTLTDLSRWNGALQVVPKSHRMGNTHRSLTIPWAFNNCSNAIRSKMKTLYLKAGQICYLHTGIIHGSGYNLTRSTRIALNSLIKDKDAQLLLPYRDERTPAGQVEIYAIDEHFSTKHSFDQKPSEEYKLLRHEERSLEPIDNMEFNRIYSTL